MARPSRVKVGPFVYKIQFMKGGLEKHEFFKKGRTKTYALGMFVGQHGLILINTEQAEEQQKETLLHELMHACAYVSSGNGIDDEESAISSISPTLWAVLRDNPRVTKWILDSD